MSELRERLLESAKKGHGRKGQTDLINHLSGKRLFRSQAIHAKCYECNGLGEENTCFNDECALFPYSQYSRNSKLGAVACSSGTFRERK